MNHIPRWITARTIGSILLLLVLSGCSDSSSGKSSEHSSLTSITVAPEDQTIVPGETLHYSATGTYTDSSTKDLSATVVWASSDTNITAITDIGLATALAEGTTSITASYGTITGSTTLIVAEPAIPLPQAPSGIRATAGDGRITLSWNNVPGATSYSIYWSNSPGVTKSTGTRISGIVTPYIHSGLTNGIPYYYVITASNSQGESSESAMAVATPTQTTPPPSSSAIIIDHTCTQLDTIPAQWIEVAKADLHIAYGHTSHGSQITTGMTGLVSFKGDLYRYSWGGSNGTLDLRDRPFNGASDLGSPNRTAWASATRPYLDTHPEINVIIWSWCGQVSYATEADINTYLNLMNGLEDDYPEVLFVYMTGHLEGTGLTGNLHLRNEQIRRYCRDNGKVLYDFGDIETYDPDGNSYAGRHPTDGCNYDYNNDGVTSESGDPAQPFSGDRNWAVDWQNAHTEGVDWYVCESAHSPPLNANLKACAAWWLWARLAGWSR